MKNVWRAVHPAARSAEKIFAYARSVHSEQQLAPELVDVQPDRRGIHQQVLVVQSALMLEQLIVHLPELALGSGGFGRLGCPFGVRMDAAERKVAEGEPQSTCQAPEYLLHDGMCCGHS